MFLFVLFQVCINFILIVIRVYVRPIHLFKKTRSTIKQWKRCRLLMKFFQTGRKQKGKVQFLLQLPPSTFVNLLDGIAACWHTANFTPTRITGIPCESLEALKITGYFGGNFPVFYKKCFFRAAML